MWWRALILALIALNVRHQFGARTQVSWTCTFSQSCSGSSHSELGNLNVKRKLSLSLRFSQYWEVITVFRLTMSETLQSQPNCSPDHPGVVTSVVANQARVQTESVANQKESDNTGAVILSA